MKEVKAILRRENLTSVVLALQKIESFPGLNVEDVRGFGRSKGMNAKERIVVDSINYVPRVKIEIVCWDDMADEIVRTIERAAHSGLRGDGKIYVTEIATAVRISTGERGLKAV